MSFLFITTFLLFVVRSASSVGLGWYLVELDSGSPTKCEAHVQFTATGSLILLPPEDALPVDSGFLVQASSPEDAVKAAVQGTITVTDAAGRSHSATFPSEAFDVGTASALRALHSRFDDQGKPTVENGMLIVLEDTYNFTDNSWGTDYDYDDFFWQVHVREVQVTANVDSLTFFTWGANTVLVEVTPASAAPYVVLTIDDPVVSTFEDLNTEWSLSGASEEVSLWGGQVATSGSSPGSGTLSAGIIDSGSVTARKLANGEDKPLLTLGSFDARELVKGAINKAGDLIKDGMESLPETGADMITDRLRDHVTELKLGTDNPEELFNLNQLEAGIPGLNTFLRNFLEGTIFDFGQGLSGIDLDAQKFKDVWKPLLHPSLGPADGLDKDRLLTLGPIGLGFDFDFDFFGLTQGFLSGDINTGDLVENPLIFVDRFIFQADFSALTPIDDSLNIIYRYYPRENRHEAGVRYQFRRPITLLGTKLDLSLLTGVTVDDSGDWFAGAWVSFSF
mmetsp:Transcript_30678/g.45414  ORF Transcript_30678/g.45414 Transcript_30678/m.45414 type:complete len:507 (-) Transcript_30678:99-1619(-)